MDNLTHGLVGAAVARAAGPRVTPLATATVVIAANAPDLDMFAFVRGPYFALAFRRGITHGWPALIVLTFLVAGGVLAWDHWVRRRRDPSAEPARAGPVLVLAAIGVASHPLLDWMNTYGIRWAMPFDGAWSYGDTLFIIDPWIWLVLGGALFLTAPATRTARLVWGTLAVLTSAVVLSSPAPVAVKGVWVTGVAAIVTGRTLLGGPVRRTMALGFGALLITTAYILMGIAGNRMARADVRAEAVAQGIEVLDVMVSPRPGTPLTSDVEVRTPDGYLPGTHSWLSPGRVTLRPEAVVPELSVTDRLDAGEVADIVSAAYAVPDVRHYLVWSRYPITRVTPHPDGWTVRVEDARYDARAGAGSLAGVETVVPAAPR